MPQLISTILGVGPGLSEILISTSDNSGNAPEPGNTFLFAKLEIDYGFDLKPIFPANLQNPVLYFSDPQGIATFTGVVSSSRFLELLASKTPSNVQNSTMIVSILACENNTRKTVSGFRISNFFPIRFKFVGENNGFLFFNTVVFLFFRLETA